MPSSSETCTIWPRPVLSRASSASRMPCTSSMPPVKSAIGVEHGSGARPLDLDDVGAEITEHLRCARPQLDLREVEHGHAVERRDLLHRPVHFGLLFSRNALTPSI